jgi:hypothetical protein
MHYLFVATNKNKKLYSNDPSFIYRCKNLGRGLEQNGHTVEFTHLKELQLLQHADVVIFHRPSFSIRLWFIVKLFSLRNIFVMMDVDDFIFDEQYAFESPAYINNILSLKKVQKQFKNNLKAFKLFSYISVSTKPLKRHIERLHTAMDVLILPNGVYDAWKDNVSIPSISSEKVISYFPGTRSHDQDFKSIEKSLELFLLKYPEIKLKITGTLNFSLNVSSNQVNYLEKVPFSDHWKNYQNVWVNLAPLVDTHFNACKSALKVMEAGYFYIPTITNYTADSVRFKDSGACIVHKQESFFNELESLLNEDYYKQVTDNLKEKILEKSNIVQISKKLITFIEYNVPEKAAQDRRERGIYNQKTLHLYFQAYKESGSMYHYMKYCMFCRDLGYPLSLVRYRRIRKKFLHNTHTKRLINEFEMKTSKYPVFMQKIVKNQKKWMYEFQKYIDNKSICIVGNSAVLKDKKFGQIIDSYDIVVRFNHCCDKKYKDDLGEKHTIWVSAPNVNYTIPVKWNIVTGPDVLYRNAHWNRFEHINVEDTKILTVPLLRWREMVCMLSAPPSAGILFLYWMFHLKGSYENIHIVGFDLDNITEQYHYNSLIYRASSRHNWIKEKKMIKQWIDEGLHILN